MALGSPGVEVQVIDESFYTPAAPGTVPLIFVATAQDKSNASGTGTAPGTTAANAGKVYVITSQRDLTETFGTPKFYTDTNGNPVHGGELNEYGLQAAYSLLGVSSRAYVARADINLAQLAGSSDAPTGTPVNGTYWIDTDASLYGVYEWDNTGRGSFVAKTPLIINNDNIDTAADTLGVPLDSFGKQGDYAMVVSSDNTNALYYKTTATSGAWVLVEDGFDGPKDVTISPHTSYPAYTTSTPAGSVWIKTTTPGNGAKWVVKYYNGSTQQWSTVSAPIYASTQKALQTLDYAGGGKNIAAGSVFVESNYNHLSSSQATFKAWRRNSTGATSIVSDATTQVNPAGGSFTIRETLASSSDWGPQHVLTVDSNTSTVALNIATAINTSGLVNVSAEWNPTTKKLTITHALGGDIELGEGVNAPLGAAGFSTYNMTTKTGTANLYTGPLDDGYDFIATNWKPLVYEASNATPTTKPADGTLWYSTVIDQVDVMIHDGTNWVGYRNEKPNTDPKGPIVSATEPTTQSDGTDLVDGDIWIDSSNTEKYGSMIYVYDGVSTLKWVLQDVTDQDSPDGWLFADARWGTSGDATDPAQITDLLVSDYVDPDAPDPALYPKGMRLWNLRRSGFNVKKYVSGHINIEANDGLNIRYQNDNMSGYNADRWVTVSPNNEDGSGQFGRKAQRGFVVASLKSNIDTNSAVRDTDTLTFNLIATPGYPETMANMVALNVDRGYTAFVVGDSPFRLSPDATTLTSWGKNSALAYDNGDTGLVTSNEYLGVFYPSGYTTDNSGNKIVVPSSHMMLRTIVNSDAKSYQWFAPAGTRRGGVDNATSVGYLLDGEFKTVALHESLRDVLQAVNVNPIATMPGQGIVNMGQKTRAAQASALDRINVVRLVAYLRRQLSILAKPFLFEPNDSQTRREIKAAAESLLLELVGQRALYDFIVVCDETNNTAARIDRSELYMDIAIEPVKAVEFIYIPLRIKNTGEIAAGI